MARAEISNFMRRLTRQMGAASLSDRSDRELVELALAGGHDAAFEAIVRRHGAMVYRVCWRILQQSHDAEDAFQGTFLVLARKLRAIRKHASLASWLHGVAHRVALRAKDQAKTRRRRESAATSPDAASPENVTWKELQVILDAELRRLPEKLRQPLVLCYLEGRTHDEAACQLGWSKSTLRRRLNEARDALGRLLTARGVAVSAAMSAMLLSDCIASGSPPPALVASTVEAAVGAAGCMAASAKVAALTEGVLKAMVLSQFKTVATALVATLCFIVGGGALLSSQTIAVRGAAPAAARGLGETSAGLHEEAQNGNKDKQTIKPRDILVLTVTGTDDPAEKKRLEAERIVRPDGTISLDSYGSTDVSKMTTEQAGAAIEKVLVIYLPKIKVQVAIKGQAIDEVWRAVEDLEVEREKLREANKIVDAARKKFLTARKRLDSAMRKVQPDEVHRQTGVLAKVDVGERKLRVQTWHETHEPDHKLLGSQFTGLSTMVWKDFAVAKDATILQDNVNTQLGELAMESHLTLTFDKDGKTVVRVAADGGTIEATFVSANQTRNTIEVRSDKKDQRRIYHLVKETLVVTEDGKPISVNDIPQDTLLFLTRSVQDANTVIRIEAIPPQK